MLCPACTQRELDAAPEGIGGWLILPAISVVLGPLINLAAALVALWAMSRMVTPLLIFAAAGGLGLSGFTTYVAVRFFMKKRDVPMLMILLQVVNVIVAVIAAGMSDKPETGGVLRSIVGAAIWIPYFMSSKRVAKTFVR